MSRLGWIKRRADEAFGCHGWRWVPVELPVKWRELSFGARSVLKDLWIHSSDDNSGLVELPNGPGRLSVAMVRMRVNGASDKRFVRRKLEELLAKGFLEETHRGWLIKHQNFAAEIAAMEADSKSRVPVDPLVRRQVLAEHGMVCWLCDLEIASTGDLHLDHVIPWSKGGPDDAQNLRPAHALCNMRRGAKDAAVFKAVLKGGC